MTFGLMLGQQVEIGETYKSIRSCVSWTGIMIFTYATRFPLGSSRNRRRQNNLSWRSRWTGRLFDVAPGAAATWFTLIRH